MRIACGIEYDGAAFCGWQAQHHGRTVQQTVEAALSRVADEPLRVHCAGRTDAGVHALGQVVHFDTDVVRSPRSWVLGANVNLPKDVALQWAREVSSEFHARYIASARSYRYIILNRWVRSALWHRRATWFHKPLDVDRMSSAAQHLLGQHDFSTYRALACQAKSPVRTIHRLVLRREGERVLIDVEADGFLHHMVRNIAGVLMTIGCGEQGTDWSRELLHRRDRRLGGVTAQPDGLYLLGVRYPAHFGIPELKGSEPFK